MWLAAVYFSPLLRLKCSFKNTPMLRYRCRTYTGAVLDDKEKTRLADLMRFRGKVPAVTPEQVAAQARAGESGRCWRR